MWKETKVFLLTVQQKVLKIKQVVNAPMILPFVLRTRGSSKVIQKKSTHNYHLMCQLVLLIVIVLLSRIITRRSCIYLLDFFFMKKIIFGVPERTKIWGRCPHSGLARSTRLLCVCRCLVLLSTRTIRHKAQLSLSSSCYYIGEIVAHLCGS